MIFFFLFLANITHAHACHRQNNYGQPRASRTPRTENSVACLEREQKKKKKLIFPSSAAVQTFVFFAVHIQYLQYTECSKLNVRYRIIISENMMNGKNLRTMIQFKIQFHFFYYLSQCIMISNQIVFKQTGIFLFKLFASTF